MDTTWLTIQAKSKRTSLHSIVLFTQRVVSLTFPHSSLYEMASCLNVLCRNATHAHDDFRVNTKLELGRVPHIVDLKNDLSNGVRLIQLLVSYCKWATRISELTPTITIFGICYSPCLQEIISGTQLGRYSMNPRMRIQCVENVNKALNFIMERGVPLTNIGAEGKLGPKVGD